MSIFVKGNAVANATSYELLEKTAAGDYSSLAEANEISFEVSALGLAPGDHTLVVKAKADGYDDSDPSNEVVYYVEEVDNNLMAENARLDENTVFVSGNSNTSQWGSFRGATATVENDYVKISCENATQGLAGIRMGVPATVSALENGTNVKISFYYKKDSSYTPVGEYKFYVTNSAASFAYTDEWKLYEKTYTWDGTWDRLQISAATTAQAEAIYYVKKQVFFFNFIENNKAIIRVFPIGRLL